MHAAFSQRARYALCSTLVCLLLASAYPSRARACRVDLFGPADDAWREAAQRLTLGADDCAALLVEVEGGHALVTLVRGDGRRVARPAGAPVQLADAIEALKRADPDEPAPLPGSYVETGSVVAPSASAPSARRAVSVMLGLSLGVRAGWQVSPLVDTALLLRIHSWELALLTDWELGYYGVDSTRPSSRGFAPALGCAHRQQLARGELLVGARLALGVLRSARSARPPPFQVADMDAFGVANPFPIPIEYQGRLAVFLGYAFPLHRLVRLRMELSGDGVWLSSSPGFRLGPTWALGTQIGIEFGAP